MAPQAEVDCFVALLLAMTARHTFAISPHVFARGLPEMSALERIEGAGKAGRTMHPQPRVRNETKHTSIVTTGSPERPGLPCAMVLTVSFALSPVTGLFCHRHAQNYFCET